MIWRRLLTFLSSFHERSSVCDVVPDDVLAMHIYSQLKRSVRNPCSVEVTVRGGLVTMRGPIRLSEMDELGDRLSQVRGIRGVENLWEIYETDGARPGLRPRELRTERPGMRKAEAEV